ncbi:BZ3500_MvSof-1268-A1-R1_Chr11-3g03504 [Microbotryum saponariae]|uniref:BZ3500_MvSof-1268-A1-R1_Chr11-3g03504 protein n=1 Tax=Microbotryum saponariae TaxID=289078 RepID=A0A2X0LVX0_9BASI|nr:BZ3500_MvSof-1268-A1-R1_Chr11-3g03504 [Microbotryum saponariae]SDA03513.1 BZ3501_MvSof-1269-A2-R1_Chr11g03081 [Microbotryum saponariae]
MRLSDFGLINHRWHKNDRHNKYAGCDAIIRCAGHNYNPAHSIITDTQ